MAHRLRELATGLGALTALVALMLGVPVVLLLFVGSPLPGGIPSVDEIQLALENGDIAESTIIKAVSWVVWLAWAQLVAVICFEAVARLGSNSSRSVRLGPDSLHRLAANLVSSVALSWTAILGAGPALAIPLTSAPPVAAAQAPPSTTDAEVDLTAVTAISAGPTSALAGSVHHAAHGDTWTSLATTYLGDAQSWPQLVEANRGRQVTTDTVLTTADPIRSGWDLLIPAPELPTISRHVADRLHRQSPSELPTDADELTTAARTGELHTVAAGDNLWTIARTHLTDHWARTPTNAEIFRYWTELIDTNTDVLGADPDLIHPGAQLVMPSLTPGEAQPVRPSAEPTTTPRQASLPPDRLVPTRDRALANTDDTTAQAADASESAPLDLIGPADRLSPADAPAAEHLHPQGATASTLRGPGAPEMPPRPATADPTTPAPTSVSPNDAVVEHREERTARGERVFDLRAGLGAAAALLSTGVLWSLRRRRRGSMARRPAGHLTPPLPALAGDIERALLEVAESDEDQEWVDRAIESLALAPDRPGQPMPQPLLAQLFDGVLEVMMHPPLLDPPAPWQPLSGGQVVRLDRSIPAAELGPPHEIYPAPAWVTVGGGEGVLRLSLEALGVLNITGTDPDGLVASIVTELCTGPGSAQVLLSSPEADPVMRIFDWAHHADIATAEHQLHDWGTGIEGHLRRSRLPAAFTARAVGTGDPWPVLVLLTRTPPSDTLLELAARGGRGIAVLGLDCLPDAAVQLRLDDDQITIAPWDLTYTAQRLAPDTLDAIGELWDHSVAAPVPVELFDRPTHLGTDDQDPPTDTPAAASDLPVGSARASNGTEPNQPVPPDDEPAPTDRVPIAIADSPIAPVMRLGAEHFLDADYDIEVRVLGPVDVVGGKELLRGVQAAMLGYLATRTEAVSADAIRDALWAGTAVNAHRVYAITSALRPKIGTDVLPSAGDAGYRLAPGRVTTDLARFRARATYAEHLDQPAAICTLSEALAMVRGQPFLTTTAEDPWWRWAHEESLTTATEAMVADIAHRVSSIGRDINDLDLAQFAAEQGLKASPHCDQLVGDLMLAHTAAGRRSIASRILADHDEAMASLGYVPNDDLRDILSA